MARYIAESPGSGIAAYKPPWLSDGASRVLRSGTMGTQRVLRQWQPKEAVAAEVQYLEQSESQLRHRLEFHHGRLAPACLKIFFSAGDKKTPRVAGTFSSLLD